MVGGRWLVVGGGAVSCCMLPAMIASSLHSVVTITLFTDPPSSHLYQARPSALMLVLDSRFRSTTSGLSLYRWKVRASAYVH